MDIFTATQQYINEMVKMAGPGMKVLLMDKETVRNGREFNLMNNANFRQVLFPVQMPRVK
jgi:hypothetical protein